MENLGKFEHIGKITHCTVASNQSISGLMPVCNTLYIYKHMAEQSVHIKHAVMQVKVLDMCYVAHNLVQLQTSPSL